MRLVSDNNEFRRMRSQECEESNKISFDSKLSDFYIRYALFITS